MELKNVAIIGAGTMGSGIAQLLALHNIRVQLIANSGSSLNRAIHAITTSLEKQVQKGSISNEIRNSSMANIKTFTSLQEGITDCELVIESVTEKTELKLGIFKQLDELCKPETILVTNTSTISITKIASVTKRVDKVVGMHFMLPAPQSKIIEIIRGYSTSANTIRTVIDLAKHLGKVPLEVNDSPGFVTSRILMLTINEAINTLYQGVAGVEEIDTVMKLGMAHRMGPLQLADYAGLDAVLNVLYRLNDGFNNPKYTPCPLLVNMVAAGHLGIKSGKGFYEYGTGAKENPVSSRFKAR